ncbi:MAG: xanthine phosphoribosyltransferase [Candidatus Delongbacteria bacterium]|nr:xanthine phosphoribosyltransferase [Candidatus Delongbacteria bacterium]MBN2835032.1 xanthine phosphoribosyltransferase [Candidatus Delongbacteria bacterium]
MELLKKRILSDGRAVDEKILKVDSFINHQIDPKLMEAMGFEFFKLFSDLKIDKVLTIESSGIAPALFTALNFNVPLVFAKKELPGTLRENFYSEEVHSFTKNKTYNCIVSENFINKDENILIIDDFLAKGNASMALIKIVEKAGAKVSGIGIVIEKGFQEGKAILIEKGYRVKSLAVIEKMSKGKIEVS